MAKNQIFWIFDPVNHKDYFGQKLKFQLELGKKFNF